MINNWEATYNLLSSMYFKSLSLPDHVGFFWKYTLQHSLSWSSTTMPISSVERLSKHISYFKCTECPGSRAKMSADHMTRANLLFNSSLHQILEILFRTVKHLLLALYWGNKLEWILVPLTSTKRGLLGSFTTKLNFHKIVFRTQSNA